MIGKQQWSQKTSDWIVGLCCVTSSNVSPYRHQLLNPESKEEPEPPDSPATATHSFSTVLNISGSQNSSILPLCPPHGQVGGNRLQLKLRSVSRPTLTCLGCGQRQFSLYQHYCGCLSGVELNSSRLEIFVVRRIFSDLSLPHAPPHHRLRLPVRLDHSRLHRGPGRDGLRLAGAHRPGTGGRPDRQAGRGGAHQDIQGQHLSSALARLGPEREPTFPFHQLIFLFSSFRTAASG